MHVVIYLFISIYEWLALIVLTFAMFKFPLRGYWGQILLTSFLLSLLSYILFEALNIRVAATILQPPVVFLCLWQIFRIHVFYAALMTVYGYLGYLLFQTSLLVLMQSLGITVPMASSLPMYFLQIISASLVLFIAWLLIRYRIGYSFVPDSEYAVVKFKTINVYIFWLTLFGYLTISSSYFVAYTNSLPLLLMLIVSITLGVLLYLAQKKEYSRD